MYIIPSGYETEDPEKKKLIVGNAQYELFQSSLSRCIHVRDERFKHVLG